MSIDKLNMACKAAEPVVPPHFINKSCYQNFQINLDTATELFELIDQFEFTQQQQNQRLNDIKRLYRDLWGRK